MFRAHSIATESIAWQHLETYITDIYDLFNRSVVALSRAAAAHVPEVHSNTVW